MQKITLPLISILTPTWNRADYLDRVWNGLNSQTYKNIEWIVGDDGSTDNTAAKLLELRDKSTFPVTIITASLHIGKSRIDNEAVARAQGELTLWNDSDDYLLPRAIEHLVAAWMSIPEDERVDYVGVTSLCGNDKGVISSKLPCEGIFDTTWNELRFRTKVEGDMLYVIRTKYLKANKFPEVDFLISEGVVWTLLGDMKVRVFPEILKIVEYGASNCISFSKRMEYCRGKAYAMAILEKISSRYTKTPLSFIWELVTFLRYCIHGEVEFAEILRIWRWNKISTVFSLIALPLAMMLVAKDMAQGTVRKTHREFLEASKYVVVTVDRPLHE
jgi:glycosyltransferase involved in cell wall biosynthesis